MTNPSDAREAAAKAYHAVEDTLFERGVDIHPIAMNAAIDAFIKASSTEDGGEAEIHKRHRADEEDDMEIDLRARHMHCHEDRATLLSTTAALRLRVRELEGRESLRAGHAAASTTFADVEPDERIIDALRLRVGELEYINSNANETGEILLALLEDGDEENAALRQDLEQMRKALEPFARMADSIDKDVPPDLRAEDEMTIQTAVWEHDQATVGDLRAAARALTNHVQSHTDREG